MLKVEIVEIGRSLSRTRPTTSGRAARSQRRPTAPRRCPAGRRGSSCPAGAPRSCASRPARPARPRWCCCTAGRRPPTSTGSPPTSPGRALPRRGPRPPGPRAGHPDLAPLPARGLRRRRRGPRRRARHRPLRAGRLLDGRPGRPADVAPPSATGSTAWCCARPAATSPAQPGRAAVLVMMGLASLAARATPGAVHRSMTERLLHGRFDRPTSGAGPASSAPQRSPHDGRGRAGARPLLVAGLDRRVDVPTAVVVTERDSVVPPRRQQRLAAAIPGATVYPVRRRPRRCAHATPSRSCPC